MIPRESEPFLNEQIITYIGNKRSLLQFIGRGVEKVQKHINQKHLSIFDVFSGSGIVARYLKGFSSKLITNDLEEYSRITNRCYLSNRSEIDMAELKEYFNRLIQLMEKVPYQEGFITELYAPRDDQNIQKGERAFYTRRNAQYIDTIRQQIKTVPLELQPYFLAPLLSEASIHANTSGIFKGFHKDSKSGIGKFGGSKGDALQRIMGDIYLPFPVFSNFECELEVYKEDSNVIAKTLEEVDLAYLDPPYNQHPYGSNYFMLNLIAEYKRPDDISRISGIPVNWNRSNFNKRQKAYHSFSELIDSIPAKYLLISFNSEGFISLKEMVSLLSGFGKLEILETKYNTFRGSRNLQNRKIHVKEYLYLLAKK